LSVPSPTARPPAHGGKSDEADDHQDDLRDLQRRLSAEHQLDAVSITASGSVGGFGLITSAFTSVVNSGHLEASLGNDGVILGGGGGSLGKRRPAIFAAARPRWPAGRALSDGLRLDHRQRRRYRRRRGRGRVAGTDGGAGGAGGVGRGSMRAAMCATRV